MPAPLLAAQCFVEAAISAGVKAGTLRLDLAKQTEAAMRGGYGDLRKVCMAARLPPLTPEEVRRRLQHEKTFTQGAADVEVVDNLYRAFFEGVAGHAKGLDFPRLEWGEAEARQLAAVLPRFAALKTLNLNGNRLGAGGVAALAPALKEMPRLATLLCAAPRPPCPLPRVRCPPPHLPCTAPCAPPQPQQQRRGRRGRQGAGGGAAADQDHHALVRPLLLLPLAPRPPIPCASPQHRKPQPCAPPPGRGRAPLALPRRVRACRHAPRPCSQPCTCAPSGSLRDNNLTEEGNQAIKAAAGAGVTVKC